MKKSMSIYTKKTTVELQKDIEAMRLIIMKANVDHHSNPQKNTNHIYRQKKEIARMLTVINQQAIT